MVTAFGKFCRKIRIEQGEILKNMADRLGVTSSYLSAVENGKREIPKNWAALIANLYHLSEAQRQALEDSVLLSKKEISFDMTDMNNGDKELVLAFARSLSDLDEDDRENLKKIFKRRV